MQEMMDAATRAAEVFVTSVMPALFPMMVLSRLMPAGGGMLMDAAFAFLSGSPAAAQRLRMKWDAGWRDESMAALTGVMSPLFFIGTLARWTGDTSACAKLLLLHWASAVITWAVWRRFSPPPVRGERVEAKRVTLPEAISQSMTALLSVVGAMMLFAMLAAPFDGIWWALLEIGGGAAAVAGKVSWPALGALCSFGGLSIWMQNCLFVGNCIRPAKLLLMRMLHGAVCYGLGLLIF